MSAALAGAGAEATLQPTALVHEAWLKLAGERHPWQGRLHFFCVAAEAMRRILVARARKRNRLKRGAHLERVPLEEIDLALDTEDDALLRVDEALEITDPDQRRDFVHRACGEDSALLNKVERLLRAHHSADRLFPTEPTRVTVEAPVAEGPGSVIGRYKLLQQIGEGGFGVVYMAEQTEPIDGLLLEGNQIGLDADKDYFGIRVDGAPGTKVVGNTAAGHSYDLLVAGHADKEL